MSTEDPIIGAPENPRGRPPIKPTGISAPTQAPAPTLLAEDSRTRAARRAAELREHLGDMDEGTDEFYIDPRVIPDGWMYQWKRKEVLGKEEPSYNMALRRRGWEEVPAERHPDMMPEGFHGSTIERKGMVLMERPTEIENEAKAIELRKARAQVRQKEQQLNSTPAGDNSPFDPTNKGSPLVKINKSYEAIPIPEK